MLNRRRFLAGAGGSLVAVAVGRAAVVPLFDRSSATSVARVSAVQQNPAPTVMVEAQEGPPYRLFNPELGADGYFPAISLSHTAPFQGGAVHVRVQNARSGTSSVFGRTYVLSPGPEGLGGFVPFGVLDPPGPISIHTQLVDLQGETQNYWHDVVVQRTEWTYDDIILPPPPTPDPNATPPTGPTPTPLPDDNQILPALYQGITSREWTLPWIIPVPLGGANIRVSGYFGEQRSFNGGPRSGHHGGTDIGAPFGTEIRASNHGRVVLSALTRVRGHLIAIDHGGGIFTSYGHMQERIAQEGDFVSRGDVIGLVGSTGLSTGAHVHWELAVGGILVDGLRWLDGTQGF